MPEPGRHAWGWENWDNKLPASPWCQHPSTFCASHLCSILEWFPKPPLHFGDERNRQGLNWSHHPPPQPIHCRRKSVSLPPLSILSLLLGKHTSPSRLPEGQRPQPAPSPPPPCAPCSILVFPGREPFLEGSSSQQLLPSHLAWPEELL